MKMYCLNCNKLYDSSDKFCHICGNKLEDELGCYAVQFLKGDQNAVEKIYRCTEGWVRALVCQSLRGADVEDCMQELYLRAFKNMKQFKGQPAAFRGWFNTVVKSGIIDYVRSQKKTWDHQAEKTDDTEDEFFDIADESIELNPEARLDKKEAYNLMDVLLNELTEEQRLCIELFYIENKKQKEIAEYLNIPLGTVKSRLFSSKEILNTKIREMEKKQGICLFGMSPIWYFMWLAHGENSDTIMAETLSKISQLLTTSGAGAAQVAGKAAAKGNVLAAKTASSAGAKAAATKAAGLGVKSLATKIAIGKNNAWYYTENDIQVLKRIKLYRDLDVPVGQIKEIINSKNGEAIFKENIASLLAKRKDNLKKQTEIARNISDNSIIDSM